MTVKHKWSYDEDKYCCEAFVENYIKYYPTPACTPKDTINEIKRALPQLDESSVRVKLANIKAICQELEVDECYPLSLAPNYSRQNYDVMMSVLRAHHIIP